MKKSLPVKIEIEEVDSTTHPDTTFFIISFSKETWLDIGSSSMLNDKLEELLTEGHIHIIINMKNISYISSAGLGILIGNLQCFRDSNGDIKLTNMSDRTHHFFEILGFARLIQIYSSREDAINSFEDDLKDDNSSELKEDKNQSDPY